MFTVAVILLALAALGGAVLLGFVLRGRHTPKGIALIHGSFAALGVVVLAIASILSPAAPVASLVLFVLAAIGGAVLIVLDLKRRQVPKGLAVGHGGIAIVAFVLLVLFWMRQ
jgi:hypothetical protein